MNSELMYNLVQVSHFSVCSSLYKHLWFYSIVVVIAFWIIQKNYNVLFLTSFFLLHFIINGVNIIVGNIQYRNPGNISGIYFELTTRNAVREAINAPVIRCR